MKGTVKWFNNQKGYGFISDAEGHDVFVHYSGLNMDGFKELKDGEAVEFEVIEGPVANALLLTTCLSMLTVPLMTSLFNFL